MPAPIVRVSPARFTILVTYDRDEINSADLAGLVGGEYGPTLTNAIAERWPDAHVSLDIEIEH